MEAAVAAARREVVHSRALRVRAEEYAGYLAASNPSASEICWPVRIGGQAEAAIFAAATAKTPMIDVQIGTARARVRAGIRGIPPDARSWIAGFHLATLAREKATLDALARVPLDLLRSPGTTGEDPSLLLAAALQAFWKREDDAPRRLLEALKATDPDRLPPSSRDHAQHILVPEMELLYRVMLQDAGGFNLALSKALEAHKAYWGSPVGGRNQEAAGFLAFGPMAMAALAHEAGMRVEVESDYLLTWLVRGDCHPTR